ncbi:hypothetical protein BDN71DRAFT_1436248 [Pleurotus eryngii]|uniref:Uncharacterized protein n=1 Tax=Pleurotus eryngii TaxID=5323 RepID=A0A9P6D932_PLEER|nr:hypothetical protein BDN71DRAFT_1436248 [Pleurotus eryngii]
MKTGVQYYTLKYFTGNERCETIKKPCLEDFKIDSESEEEDGNDNKHDKVPLEQDIEALEHAHEMGALAMLIQVLQHLRIVPEASDSSQDVAIASVNEENHSPSLNDNSTTLNGAKSNIPTYRTPEPHQGSDSIHQIATQPRNRHHGLLGERASPPFDKNIWKDWILTPLELRHSQAPRESEYDGFPDLGCACSDVSNGWVVTHSKTLIIDNLEAVKFVDVICYQANKIEIMGNEREDTIHLRFDYPHTFEQTIFEHPWLLDFQRHYKSTYSLKSTLSEHDKGETLPRGTLTHNGSWNHQTQDMDHAPLPRTYMMRADPLLSPLEALYPCPLDTSLPMKKQQIGCHEGLDLIAEVVATILQTENSDVEPDTVDSESKTPSLQYPELEQDRSMTDSDTTTQERPSIHPHPIFPAILPSNALHPGGTFIELQTDQPDIWGFNDFESTVVRLQTTPLYATTIEATECIDPPVNHSLWNEDLGQIEQIRTMQLYDGDVHQYNLICKAEHYVNFVTSAELQRLALSYFKLEFVCFTPILFTAIKPWLPGTI